MCVGVGGIGQIDSRVEGGVCVSVLVLVSVCGYVGLCNVCGCIDACAVCVGVCVEWMAHVFS